jgi:hypothetical protein
MIVRAQVFGGLKDSVGYIVQANKAAATELTRAVPSVELAEPIFRQAAALAPAKAKPYMTVVVSYELGEDVSVAKALEISKDVLAVYGITEKGLAVTAAHADAEHRHTHTVAVRVDPATQQLSVHPRAAGLDERLLDVAAKHGFTMPDRGAKLGRGARNAEIWNGRESFVRAMRDRLDPDIASWEQLDAWIATQPALSRERFRNGWVIVDRSGRRTYRTGLRSLGFAAATLRAWGPAPVPVPRETLMDRDGYGARADRAALDVTPEIAAHPEFDPQLAPAHAQKRLGEYLRRGAWRKAQNEIRTLTQPQESSMNGPVVGPEVVEPRVGPAAQADGRSTTRLATDLAAQYLAHLRAFINRQDILAEIQRIQKDGIASDKKLGDLATSLSTNPLDEKLHRQFAQGLRSLGRVARAATLTHDINEHRLGAHHALTFEAFVEKRVREGKIKPEEAEQALLAASKTAELIMPAPSMRRQATTVLAQLDARLDTRRDRVVYMQTLFPGVKQALVPERDMFSVDRDGYFYLEQSVDNEKTSAAMLLAAAKRYNNRITITDGKASSREYLARLAGQLGIEVANPELQQAWNRGNDVRRERDLAADQLAREPKEPNEPKAPGVRDLTKALTAEIEPRLAGFGANKFVVLPSTSKNIGQTVTGRYVDIVRAGNDVAVLALNDDGTLYATLTKDGLPKRDLLAGREGEQLRMTVDAKGQQTIDRMNFDELYAAQEQRREESLAREQGHGGPQQRVYEREQSAEYPEPAPPGQDLDDAIAMAMTE